MDPVGDHRQEVGRRLRVGVHRVRLVVTTCVEHGSPPAGVDAHREVARPARRSLGRDREPHRLVDAVGVAHRRRCEPSRSGQATGGAPQVFSSPWFQMCMIGTVSRPVRDELVRLVVDVREVGVDAAGDRGHAVPPLLSVQMPAALPDRERLDVHDARVGDQAGRRDALLLHRPRHAERAGRARAPAVEERLRRRVVRGGVLHRRLHRRQAGRRPRAALGRHVRVVRVGGHRPAVEVVAAVRHREGAEAGRVAGGSARADRCS